MKALLLALAVFAAFGLVAYVLLVSVVDTSETDCAKVRDPAPGAWQAGDFDRRDKIVRDLSLCQHLQGRSQEEVEQLLGPPGEVGSGELRYKLPTGGAGPQNTWVLFFDADGRLTDTRYDVVTGL